MSSNFHLLTYSAKSRDIFHLSLHFKIIILYSKHKSSNKRKVILSSSNNLKTTKEIVIPFFQKTEMQWMSWVIFYWGKVYFPHREQNQNRFSDISEGFSLPQQQPVLIIMIIKIILLVFAINMTILLTFISVDVVNGVCRKITHPTQPSTSKSFYVSDALWNRFREYYYIKDFSL